MTTIRGEDKGLKKIIKADLLSSLTKEINLDEIQKYGKKNEGEFGIGSMLPTTNRFDESLVGSSPLGAFEQNRLPREVLEESLFIPVTITQRGLE